MQELQKPLTRENVEDMCLQLTAAGELENEEPEDKEGRLPTKLARVHGRAADGGEEKGADAGDNGDGEQAGRKPSPCMRSALPLCCR